MVTGRPVMWTDIVQHWASVVADLAERGVDLYAADVQARSWLGVRTMILSLVSSPSRLAAALKG